MVWGHPGFLEEGVVSAHDGGGLDVGCAGEREGAAYELGRQAEGSELGVDDDSGDGAKLSAQEDGAGSERGGGGESVVGGEVAEVVA